MSAATPSKTRWIRSIPALLACLATVAQAEDRVRFYFKNEGQAICVQQRNGEVEAVVLAGGRVQRRGRGPATPEFLTAVEAIGLTSGEAPPRPAVARETLIERNFFFLAHPRCTAAGGSTTGVTGIARLRTVAGELALALPTVESSGLYILAFPASTPGPQEDILAAKAVPPSSPLHTALAAPGFPLRVTSPADLATLPRQSVFSVKMANGDFFLVSYLEGSPFSLRDWLKH